MEQPRKRKRTLHKAHNSINDLPDDILIDILSRLTSRNEATKTSLISRRWRYLWRSLPAGSLELDNRHLSRNNKVVARVNHALKSHRRLPLDGLVIRFAHLNSLHHRRNRNKNINNWIRFALRKKVKTLELSFSKRILRYQFPSCNLNKFGSFGSLRSLTLAGVDVRDEVVQQFLSSCPSLQQLCIRRSRRTKNLRVLAPNNLKVLEISYCENIARLQVSSTNLVSCTFRGYFIDLQFKDTTSLSELTLGGSFARSFVEEPFIHSAYSQVLVKLTLDLEYFGDLTTYEWPPLYSLKHLELNIKSPIGYISFSLFTSLIEAAPLLNEFRIEMLYTSEDPGPWRLMNVRLDPELRYCHTNLKAVKMSGYVGWPYDDCLVLCLLVIAPSIEMVTIDTEINYRKTELRRTLTRIEAIERAEKLSSSFPPNTLLFVT